jgi:hypothetical protein
VCAQTLEARDEETKAEWVAALRFFVQFGFSNS